jgi:hypothetical protein
MTKSFFSVDADGYVERHGTAEEAEARAVAELEHQSDCAVEGWHDGVTAICWGVVIQYVALKSRTETPGGRFDAIEEYELVGPSTSQKEVP